MSNGAERTETARLENAYAHSACKIADFERLNDVTMKCYLEQKGKVVNQFYDPTINGIFKAEVCLHGDLRYHLCGTLCLCLHIECVGPADPKVLPCVRIELDPCKDPKGVDGENKACYDFEVNIPQNHLSAGDCGTFCCFVATLTSETFACPGFPPQRGHICCYCKGPCVMVCAPPEHIFGS